MQTVRTPAVHRCTPPWTTAVNPPYTVLVHSLAVHIPYSFSNLYTLDRRPTYSRSYRSEHRQLARRTPLYLRVLHALRTPLVLPYTTGSYAFPGPNSTDGPLRYRAVHLLYDVVHRPLLSFLSGIACSPDLQPSNVAVQSRTDDRRTTDDGQRRRTPTTADRLIIKWYVLTRHEPAPRNGCRSVLETGAEVVDLRYFWCFIRVDH